MHDPVDDLQIGSAPIAEQQRPRLIAMFPPDLVEWHPVVDFRRPEQSLA
jgi:hypothetical protein